MRKSQKEYKTKGWETYLMIVIYSQTILKKTFVKVYFENHLPPLVTPSKVYFDCMILLQLMISCRQYGGPTSLEILRTFHYARTIKQVLV